MYENVKAMLKDLIPPALLRISRKVIKSGVSFSGSFGTWEEAEKNSIGYDSDVIFEKTRNALLKVKSGEATHERDSVLFDEIQYSWPLLAGLMWVAARNGGVLNVMDFGGSFGSTYFQNKAFLRCLPSVRWNIVEQPKHVQAGPPVSG